MDIFSRKNLTKTYNELKLGKLNTGLDRINRRNFDKNLNENIQIIERKVNDFSYEFTPYKEVLLLKGRDKYPRVLSIPTIRDKIILKILGNEIKRTWGISSNLQETIDSIKENVKKNIYNYYVKLDISGYYSSIPHDTLIKTLSEIISNEKILSLIIKSIKTHTYSTLSTKEDRTYDEITVGVPQGLSISNGLGYAYLKEYDSIHNRKRKYKYYRYVDDILILCKNESDGMQLHKIISEDLYNKYGLNLGETKSDSGFLDDGFTFLGYKFNPNGSIEISHKNISRIENNIETLFHQFNTSTDKRIKGNAELLKWKIDLKISGLIKNKKIYGWVYYFRNNENIAIMHRLDDFVVKMVKRFHLEKYLLNSENKYNGNKFVKMFYEIKSYGNLSNKIINVDNFTLSKKREILKRVCKRKADTFSDFYVEIEFNKFIFKSIQEIEYDLHQQYMG